MIKKVRFSSATSGSVLSRIDIVGVEEDGVARRLYPILLRLRAQVVMTEVTPSEEGFHQSVHVCSLDGGRLDGRHLVRLAAEIARAFSGQRSVTGKGVEAA